MIIGCTKEIKRLESRVGLIPATVRSLISKGAKVLIECGAGDGSNISDQQFIEAGAAIVKGAQDVWQKSDIIVKVKEPLAPEFQFFRKNLVVYTFLHLAAEPALTKALLDSGVTGIAYETVEENNSLPLLKPMSEVAGRMAIQVGAWCLEKKNQGKGILLSGVPGASKARILILGAGVVGKNAAKMALGMGADVTMLDINAARLEEMDDLFFGRIKTMYSCDHTIEEEIKRADLVVGAVLLPGAKAPRLVTHEMVRTMEKGSVVVDVAVDQGGCVETVHRTMHDDPTYVVDGVVHYGVANMPGAVPATSTMALGHVTAPYLVMMAEHGVRKAIQMNGPLRSGVNTIGGTLVNAQVAKALDMPHTPLEQVL